MLFRIVATIAGVVCLIPGAIGQTYSEEALLFSRTTPGATARVNAMGGVMNSLGGDLSTASYNPAGLGMYNRSEFSLSPMYTSYNISSNYLNTTTSASQNPFTIPNLGVAIHGKKDGTNGFWGGTFAISYSRINDFNKTFTYKGTNSDNSIVDYFIQDANGRDSTQFAPGGYNYNTPTGLSYFNYLIGPANILNPSNPKDQYFTDVYGIPFQTETVKTSGSQGQWNFSYGVNFNDRIFVGAGLGFALINYKSDKTYSESFSDPAHPLTNMVLNESLSISGSGFNFTLGTIIRPVDGFQFGISATTPTGYSISDTYSATMTSSWKNFEYLPGLFLNNLAAGTDNLSSSYKLKTPWRVTGGATFFIQKKGFISVDAEWIDYGGARYSSDFDDYSADNEQVSQLFKSTINLRVGGEYRWNNYRFRGGYNIMPDPYASEQNGVSNAKTTYSVGGGYRTDKFYVDLALMFGQTGSSYRPYTVNLPTSPVVKQDHSATQIQLTLGLPF